MCFTCLIDDIEFSDHIEDTFDEFGAPHRRFDLIQLDKSECKILLVHRHAQYFLSRLGIVNLFEHVICKILLHLSVLEVKRLEVCLTSILVVTDTLEGHGSWRKKYIWVSFGFFLKPLFLKAQDFAFLFNISH